MKLTLLGTGTPAPSLKRQSSGYLVEIGDDKIILDHGPGAHHRLLEAGYRSTDPTHALFTHLHYDHFIDYPRLVLQRWDMGAGKIPELQVFGPDPLKRITETLFGEDGVFGPDLEARTNHQASLGVFQARGGQLPRRRPAPAVTEVKPGDSIEGRGWRAIVGESSHAQPHLRCYSYRLETDRSSLCYAGDSGGVCREVIESAQGADVLIHMTHFASGTEPSSEFRNTTGGHRDVAEVARRADVGALIVTHIAPPIDTPGTRERIIAEMAQIYPGPIIWGEDLMQLSVPHLPSIGID